jgi:hypothetical protein
MRERRVAQKIFVVKSNGKSRVILKTIFSTLVGGNGLDWISLAQGKYK